MQNSLLLVAKSKNEDIFLLLLIVINWAIFFGRNLLGVHYTSWDTHDLGFTFFLYFSDALNSGNVPFWNPFIHSGTFHAGLFNSGNYTPFQWIFLLLSQFISPVYCYELMIQVVSLIGVAGFYLWLRAVGTNKLVTGFVSLAFFLSVLMPLVGQIMFLFSLSALPWIFLVCYKAISDNKEKEWAVYLLWAALIASFIVSGYPWMNVINFILAFLYACNLLLSEAVEKGVRYKFKITSGLVNLLIFFVGAVVLIACYYAPGYFSLKFYYHIFAGDYVSPEPRLRSLLPIGSMSYQGILDAFFAAIDPRILIHNITTMANFPIWTWGTGWVVCLVLIYRNFDKAFLVRNGLWVGLLIFWLLYAAGALGPVVRHIPLFNANRWWFIGSVYVSICLIVLSIDTLKYCPMTSSNYKKRQYLSVGFIASLMALTYFSAPLYEYVLVTCIVAIIYYLVASTSHTQWRVGLAMLMVLNLVAFATMPHSMPGASRSQQRISSEPAQNYYNKIHYRNVSTDVFENYRRLGHAREYLFNDESWLIKKIPFSHGYNPLGNPLYWYLKDETFLERIVYMTQNVREEKKILRENFSNDKDFTNALIADVQTNSSMPTIDSMPNSMLTKNPDFRWELKDFKLEPNQAKMQVKVNGGGYIVFNNTYFPGWEVLINGKMAPMVSVNRIFQGVYVNGAGDYDVTFRFRSFVLIGLLVFPPLMLLLTFFVVLRKKQSIFFV